MRLFSDPPALFSLADVQARHLPKHRGRNHTSRWACGPGSRRPLHIAARCRKYLGADWIRIKYTAGGKRLCISMGVWRKSESNRSCRFLPSCP